MKKLKISVAAILIAGTSLVFTSCIGSFSLTNKVLSWNKHIGPKFVNELVFVAFWILPVYEVTSLADLLVINSIEFWSGNNPITALTKVVDTDNGRYLISWDGSGYTVTHELSGDVVRLDFDQPTQTWSVENKDGEAIPFMTFVDDNHVKMLTTDGNMMEVELSEQGLMAYESALGTMPMALR